MDELNGAGGGRGCRDQRTAGRSGEEEQVTTTSRKVDTAVETRQEVLQRTDKVILTVDVA